ncbi:hypothetical protein BDW22DRAFT_1347247 [Trametopsis cervina]|nr:hypothetical protein BDW22DRAFT_1347247 [Trametopsis cervina]
MSYTMFTIPIQRSCAKALSVLPGALDCVTVRGGSATLVVLSIAAGLYIRSQRKVVVDDIRVRYMTTLENAQNELEETRRQHYSEVENLGIAKTQLEQQAHGLHTTIAELQARTELTTAERAAVQTELASCNARLFEFEQKWKDINYKLEEANRLIAQLRAEKRNIQGALKHFGRTKDAFTETGLASRDLLPMKSKLFQVSATCEMYNGQNQQLRAELAAVKKALDAKLTEDEEVEELNIRIKDLEQSLETTRRLYTEAMANAGSQKALAKAKETCRNAVNEKERYVVKLELAETQIVDLSSQLQDTTSDLSDLNTRYATMERERDQYKKQVQLLFDNSAVRDPVERAALLNKENALSLR